MGSELKEVWRTLLTGTMMSDWHADHGRLAAATIGRLINRQRDEGSQL